MALLTRDIRIRHRPAEKRLFLAHGVKAVFLTKAGSMTRWDMLRMVVRHWDEIESLHARPGPLACSLTAAGLRELKLPIPPPDRI